MSPNKVLSLWVGGVLLLGACIGVLPETIVECNEFQFQCDTGQCIRSIYRCDLEPDCDDGSDEVGCDDVSCTDDLFKCGSGRCIPKAFICDTDADCDDGTDERNCSHISYNPGVMTTSARPTAISGRGSCEDWQFQCGNGNCIRGTYQCDDDKDCPDGSDEFGCEPCVTTNKLEFGGPPFCKVRIYKGSSRVRNETQCVLPDVFLVKPGRLMPYDRRSYTEAKVNYVRIICDSYYPVDFNFDGVGHIEQIRVLRTQKTGLAGLAVHSTDVTTVVTPQATGNYIFTQIYTNTSTMPKITSLFFYFEKEKKPFLLGNERIQKAKRESNETFITLPCVTAKVNVTLYLYQNINETWSRVNSSQYTYNPLKGFQLDMTNVEAKLYKCTTDASFTSDVDVVTVTVDEALLRPAAGALKLPSNLKIVLGPGLSATCHSIGPLQGSKLEFTNVYAENPLDSKILADCVLKGSLSCGSYSHVRNHHPISDDLKCRHGNQKTKCRHISEIYSQGVLVCQSESEFLVQRYFTGLDDVLYKDWRHVPKSALIRIETTSNLTTGIAGNSLTTKCTAVGMVFARNAITFESRSNGTDVVVKHSSGGYHSYSYTLRVNMSQFLCADHIWETDQEIWSDPINVTVSPRIIICSYLEFKCLSGQCIRASYKCDGDRDCLDASDEANCPSTTTTTTTEAPVICSYLQFYCYKYKNTNETTEPCIPAPYRCDGDPDCHFGEDEENCTYTTTTSTTTTTTQLPNGGCGLNMFRCNNGDCIRASYKCDSREDCRDGSDEGLAAGCPTTTTALPPSTIQAISNEAQAEEIGLLLDEEHKSKMDQAAPSSGPSALNITLILFAVILAIVLLSLGGVTVYRRYQSHGSRGTSSASNIKYRNPTQDQEEVLID